MSAKDLERLADEIAFAQHGGVCRRPRNHPGAVLEWFGRGTLKIVKDGIRRDGALDSTGRGVTAGRGSTAVDLVCSVETFPGNEESVPVLLKGNGGSPWTKNGTLRNPGNRDISMKHAELIAYARAGGELWTYHLWMDGEVLMMRRIDAARVIRECPGNEVRTNHGGIGPGVAWGVRLNSQKAKSGKVYYGGRLRIEWSRVPASMWLDPEPIRYDSRAPLY